MISPAARKGPVVSTPVRWRLSSLAETVASEGLLFAAPFDYCK
jgi:hypothetical protein